MKVKTKYQIDTSVLPDQSERRIIWELENQARNVGINLCKHIPFQLEETPDMPDFIHTYRQQMMVFSIPAWEGFRERIREALVGHPSLQKEILNAVIELHKADLQTRPENT